MKLKLMPGYIGIEKQDERTTKSGLILGAEELDQTIVGKTIIPNGDFKKGQTVICQKFAAYELEHEGEKCLVVNTKDVIGYTE